LLKPKREQLGQLCKCRLEVPFRIPYTNGMKLDRMIGNCTMEDVVEDIFGSVSEFARLVEENGDEFLYKNSIVVKYDEDNDVHYFFEL